MPKKSKEDVMKDTYTSSDDIRASRINGFSVSSAGMRHSIRPRRSLVAEYQEPASPDFNAAPVDEGRFFRDPDAPRWKDLAIEPSPVAQSQDRVSLDIAAADRAAATRAFDLLRTRLRQTTQEHGWTNIAVTAPTSGCGNTFTALNLALSLSRVPGSRTVLMDMNMRNPGLSQALEVDERGAIGDFLAGRATMGNHMMRVNDTLAVALSGASEADPAETLQDATTARTLDRMRAALRPEIVIYDMPAMLAYDDLTAFLPQLDGVLLVSDGTQTMARQLVECERMLEGQVPLLGVVLNRARPSSIPHYS